jgi:hypothetical protein
VGKLREYIARKVGYKGSGPGKYDKPELRMLLPSIPDHNDNLYVKKL